MKKLILIIIRSNKINSIYFSLFALLIFIPVFNLNAQENINLLLITESDTAEITEYENLSIQIYSDLLLDKGITAVPYISKDQNDKTTEKYCSEARNKQIDFYAVNTISIASEIITINSMLFKSASGDLIFEASSSGSITLGLEKKLNFLASQSSAVLIEKSAALHQQEPNFNKQVNSTVDKTAAEVYPPDKENPSKHDPVVSIAEIENIYNEQTPSEDAIKKWGLNISTAAVIPLGRSADYLSPGSRISASISTFFPAGNICLSPGLYTAVTSFKAEGDIRETENRLLDFGFDFTLSIPGKSRYIPFISLAAGLSIFGVTDNSDPWLWKTIPAGGLTIGSDILLTPDIGIKASCDSNIYIESSLLIITFQPSLGGLLLW